MNSKTGSKSPINVTTGLLGGILAALVILIVAVINAPDGGSRAGKDKFEADRKTTPEPPPPKPDNPNPITRDEKKDTAHLTTPSHAVEVSRVESTYTSGKRYRTIARFDLKARGTCTSWGVTVAQNLFYLGEMQVTRLIESNDGKTIVLTQDFDRAQSIRVATNIENIDFYSGGWVGETALALTDWSVAGITGIYPGWSQDIRASAQFLANTDIVKNLLSRVATDNDAKVMAYLDKLQGKRVRITYVNGQGVQRVEPLGCALSEQEQNLIFASAVLSDTYILPDPEAKVGTTWDLYAQDILPMIDTSMNAYFEGKISARRATDEGSGDGRKAVVELEQGGHYDLHGFDKGNAYYGAWYPTGKMWFSFRDRIVTKAHLGGEFSFEKRSTDHWIFETKFTAKPRYNVNIISSVLQ